MLKYLLGIMLKMSKKSFANKYVRNYQSSNIPWYEHDVLLTYIDTLKCKEFLDNCYEHFSNIEVVSFAIIHYQCRGTHLQNSVESYKTISKSDFKNYPEDNKKMP